MIEASTTDATGDGPVETTRAIAGVGSPDLGTVVTRGASLIDQVTT